MDDATWRRVQRLVVPDSIEIQDGPGPEDPVDFESGFVLPVHTTKPLQILNSTEIDEHMEFHELPHVYTMDGVPASTSVTALAHEYESPFDPESAIEMMKSSRSQAWPRLEYVCDAQVLSRPSTVETAAAQWSPSRGALLVSPDGKTLASCQPHSLAAGTDVRQILLTLAGVRRDGASSRSSKRPKVNESSSVASKTTEPTEPDGRDDDDDDDDGWTFHTFSRAMTDAEIMEGWKRKGTLASNKGTHAHYLSELFMNGLPSRRCPETDILAGFALEHMVPHGIIAFNTEKEIMCRDADVAGSIDLIVFDPKRKIYHIVDHKRSDKLKKQMRGYGKMREPFRHLDDCKGAAYALQTSIYQYILERDYGMTIGDRVLLSLHPDAPFVTSVPYLKEEVRFIMDTRIQLVRARRRVRDACPDGSMTCALTKAPLVDAVVLPDGRRCMLKAASVRKLEYERDEERAAAFESRVRDEVRVMESEGDASERVQPLDTAKCLSWKRSMPVDGIGRIFG